jgi:hypothetical protein
LEYVPMSVEDPLRRAALDEKQFVTGRISESVRYVGFGLLAIFYAVVSSDSTFAIRLSTEMSLELRGIAIAGAAAVLLDYLQYLCGGIVIEAAIKRTGEGANLADRESLPYKGRTFFYWVKQVPAFAGCVLLIIVLARAS